MRGASGNRRALGKNVSKQKGPIMIGFIHHQGKFGIVGFTASVQILSDQLLYLLVPGQNTL
jgi:hypothetical protein